MNANGTGSIHARELKKLNDRGKPIIVYDVHFRDDLGKSQTKRGFSNPDEAQKYLNYTTARLDDGLYVKKNKVTVAELADLWFAYYITRRISESTKDWHRYNIPHIKQLIGSIPIQNLTSERVVKFISELSKAKYRNGQDKTINETTVSNILRTLKQGINYGVGKKFVHSNVMKTDDVKGEIALLHMDMEEFEGISVSQAVILKLILAASTAQERLVIALAGLMGLRKGEIRGLRIRDINFENSTLKLSKQLTKKNVLGKLKTKKSARTLNIHPYVMGLIKDVINDRDTVKCEPLYGDSQYSDLLLIHTKNKQYLGRPFSGSYYNDLVDRLTKKCDVQKLRVHDLRHSFGSNLIYMGVPIITVSALLGHKDPVITLRIYAHEVEEMAKKNRQEIADKLTADLALLDIVN